MRIDCPKCGAAFAIDERRVPPKGVRAQCPLCGERVVVRLGGAVAPPPNRAAPEPGAAPGPRTAGDGGGTPAGPAVPGGGVVRSASPVTPTTGNGARASAGPAVPEGGPGRPAGRAEPAASRAGNPPAATPEVPAPFLATVPDTMTPGPLGLVDEPFPHAPPAPPPAVQPGPPPANGAVRPIAPPPPAPGATPAPVPPGPFASFADLDLGPAPEPTPSDLLGGPAPDVRAPRTPAPRPRQPPPDEAGAHLAAGLDVPFPVERIDLPPVDLDPVRELASAPPGGPAPARPPSPVSFAAAGAAPAPGTAAAAPAPGTAAAASAPGGPTAGVAAPADGGAVWRIRHADGVEEPPVPFSRLKAMVEARELAADDELARGEGTFWPALEHPAVQAIVRRSRPVVATAGPPEPSRRGPARALALAAVALVAVGAAAFVLWPRGDSTALRLTGAAFEERLAAWRAAFPAPAGSAADHEKRGRALLREDTPESLGAAADEFRRAVLLDPENAAAIAGYVEARALAGIAPDDRAAIEEARALVDHAAQLAGQNPHVLRANAHLLLSLESAGNLLQARTLADAAVQRSGGAPDDLVALGRSHIGTNVELALGALDRALAKDPAHRRALLYRGRANERVARYAAAAADYEKRLELAADQDDPEALRALLQLIAGVGDYERLRSLLEGILAAREGHPWARLGLGVLAHQVDGDRARAASIFAGLLADRTLPPAIRGRAAGHAAALAREAGDLDGAEKLAGQAGAGIDGAPARYQQVLLALARGRLDEARATLDGIPAGALDPAERALLEGRIHTAAGRHREAVASFQAARRSAPRRLEPYLQLAASHARLGDAQGTFGALRGVLDFDPAAGGRGGALTDFFEGTASRLAGLDRPLVALGGDRVELALAHAAAGMVRYHRGEADAAATAFRRTLDLDPQAMPALAYEAQLALDRGQHARALELARTASALEKLLPLGPFLEGRAHEAAGELERATSAYERALAASPSFYPAAVRLGELALRAGRRDEAEKRFFQVFLGDPENAEARVALFRLGR